MDNKVREINVHQCVNASKVTMPGLFDEQLLDHIRNGRNDEAEAMLTKELAQAFDDSSYYGTLLQHAAEHNNAVIARRLIELGADVNLFGSRSSPPLGIAMLNLKSASVQVLLEAGARLDIVYGDGCSVLQDALEWLFVGTEAFELFVRKLRTDVKTNEELAEMLIRSGCNMVHAATLRDVDLMECMLRRGVDVNLRSDGDETALHVAASLNDRKTTDWLLKKGIDVDAVDHEGSNALTKSAENGNKYIMQRLLEHGADPDAKASRGPTPLCEAFRNLSSDKFVDCAELLLQRGASIPGSNDPLDKVEYASDSSCDKAVELLVAHSAMLAVPVDNSVIESLYYNYGTRTSNFGKYYESCQQVLTFEVFEKLTVLDLLSESDRKMRLLVRKETFLQEVKSFEDKLSKMYSYYYHTLIRRVAKARCVVKLENQAILVICKIFKANCNQLYDFARGVVEYLNKRDLECLVQV